MAFLFKSKKQQTTSLPQATRNIHTSEGTPSSGVNGFSEKGNRNGTPPPASSVNNSLQSLGGTQSPDQQWTRRERSESESQFPTPQSNPFPRYGAAVNTVASKEGDIYMMGGLIDGSMVKGDLWMVEAAGGNLACYPIATVSEGPGPRVGHAALLVGNAFIVFGGDTKLEDNDQLDDTLYLLNTSSRQWSRASPPGQRPVGRYGHTLNILGSRIYVFGGQVEGLFFNDLMAFDLNNLQNPVNQWEYLIRNSAEGGPQPGQIPPARTNHTVISYQDQLFLFGGTNGTQWFNDVWSYDPRTNTWSQQDCIGYIPQPREGHSAALVGDVMYIFGGRTEEGTDLGDLAAFRIASKRWYTFQNMGPSPSPRSGHSMTAHGKQIIVLAGEPSSAPRDPSELSMVYVLDTGKIRYPNDQAPAPQAATSQNQLRRPSGESKGQPISGRSPSSQGQVSADAPKRSVSTTRESQIPPPGPIGRPPDQPPSNPPNSRLPRASVAQAPAGPPPTGQPPNPRMQAENLAQGPRSKTPTKDRPQDTIRAVADTRGASPVPKDPPQEPVSRSARDPSPGSQGRRTPTQPTKVAAKAMEAGEAAPLVSGGPARQRSLRSQRGQNSIDGIEDVALGRSSSGRVHSDASDRRSSRLLMDGPRSPKITPHQEALTRELEAAKSQNAWYASELALAKKAGYVGASSNSPMTESKVAEQFGDDDRPLIEAFLNMRAELARMQQTVDQQASVAAKKMAEVEHQRDAAVTEAAYARAKLAAHSGSQRSTPQPDSAKEIDDMHPERSTDISRRLALALASLSEHKSRVESLSNEVQSEKNAREVAEHTAEAAHKRLDDVNKLRNPLELEGLRAELQQCQRTARDEAAQRAQAEEGLRLLQLSKNDLDQRHDILMNRLGDYGGSLTSLQAAVAASSEKAEVLERQLEKEREQRETTERKLLQLKGEHEDRTAELENTARRLRDSEELAETHAKEANVHKEALMAGLGKAAKFDPTSTQQNFSEERIAVLQQSTDRAHALARSNQQAADAASEKLRAAEERIAGLEAYQEQTSREGLHIRKQLQTALKDVHGHQTETRELKNALEGQRRDANALAVQHNTLKDLLGERGVNMSDVRRSPLLESGPRFGTPEHGRFRELEQQLQASKQAHEETKATYDTAANEAHRQYSEKLEQLENDYQSTIHYVKGTEKILKRMKDELSKYKTHNSKLQSELDAAQKGSPGSTSPAGWEAERQVLQRSIDDIRVQSSAQIASLESSMAGIHGDLAAARSERDAHKASHEDLVQNSQRLQEELEQLQSENTMLEAKAADAETRVTMLLDQVGQSVGNFRRQSQIAATQHGVNGGHARNQSHSTAGSNTADHDSEDASYNENRGSLTLNNLASELDALRSHWESTNKSYRLSNQFDFERTPTKENAGSDLTDSLASWRKRLDDEEDGKNNHAGAAVAKEDGMI
ncbi:MAG: hypothetical protein Q9160_005563 [Pyrenula sp. 1 TL-2023]